LLTNFFDYCVKTVQLTLGSNCSLCGTASQGALVCGPCQADLPEHRGNACRICAVPLPSGEVCGRCLKQPPAFDHTLAAFVYGFPVDRLIQSLKYGHNLPLAEFFGDGIANSVKALPLPDLLIPMPLHQSRLRERGFNQAIEIGRSVSRKTGLPLVTGWCARIRETGPQAQLNLQERVKNIRNAFVCGEGLTGLKVAIIDDVMTSGATLNELAGVLRASGAASVSAWVAARALPPGN
jgi:ComF family protein